MTRPHRLFITGTGTGVGKTLVAATLAQGLAAQRRVSYWKPVQTGDDDDTATAATLAGAVTTYPPAFRFAAPASPDQAAAAAAAPAPTVAALMAQLRTLAPATPEAGKFLLIEGAGGILVPLNYEGETWADLLAATDLPTLVVAASGLGTLNHTGLTVRLLQDRGVRVAGIVLSGERHPENEASLARLHPDVPVHPLPHVDPAGAPRDWTNAAAALAAFVEERLATLAAAAAPGPWLAAAARHVWFPYTQHRTAPAPIPIARARGVWLETPDGERLLDGTSAWWVNTIGHGRPEVARAVARQQQTLDHVLFAGAAHEGAARLAAKVTGLAGHGLTRAFFSDNGSTAVEIALKMAFQSFVNRGERGRTRFLTFEGSYHGDTFGAMSVGRAGGFHSAFAPLLFATLAAAPVTEHPSAVCPAGSAALPERLAALAATLDEHHTTLAGIVLEPLLQGAGGMLVQPTAFVQGVAALAQRYGLPLILDEVFTGLGRVGAPFAFQRAGIEPDLVALAKGLTGGNLPLALTLAKEEHFEAFLSDHRGQALLHGHSFTGNPIACAAALAALGISEREDLPGRARRLEARFQRWLAEVGSALGVQNGRALGGVLAFELPGSGAGDYFHAAADRLPAVARRHGLFLRPLGNTVYLAPPLVISEEESDFALAALAGIVQDLIAGSN